jgi:hypothetical protein
MTEDYYLSSKQKLLRTYDWVDKWVIKPLANQYGKELSMVVAEKAHKEYEALIPQTPFIGGAQNHWTADLIESVQLLAIFRAMHAFGKPSSEIADVIYEGMQIRLEQYPHFLLRWLGRLQFSRLFVNRLMRLANETQKRIYQSNFVAEIVIGDGNEFDWGIDFCECAIYKFYKAQNALELLPYVCKLDYLTSKAFGLGLVRTKTLAEGDDRCNPRLKRGRETKWR